MTYNVFSGTLNPTQSISDGDLTIYKMAAVRHLGFLKCKILTTIEVQSKCGSSCLVMAGS